ncbi:hypothetical protein D9V32_14790 [Mycetocola tolaasinivorans]|uniref:Uncharacterized protein n=1 Tax=Mycetocola tolaasinivorans TaxID=76635 RepID=A0A3L6ZYS1_9MICO|nr:hypothetical protein [Mycetocola tolaasinivorans]RLP73193.1 hypothetical protein D9V32_14790 [Mycetocola tolaasinivorans]
MKASTLLRAANPVPPGTALPARPELAEIVPGFDVDGSAAAVTREIPRRTRTRRTGIVAATLVAAATVTAVVIAVGSGPSAPPQSDSPHYPGFAELAAASTAMIDAEVVSSAPATAQGGPMTAYTVNIRAATDERAGSATILIPSSPVPGDTLAETRQLVVGQRYLLAIVPYGERWQLSAPAGQAAFPITDDAVGTSLDGSLRPDSTTRSALGLR